MSSNVMRQIEERHVPSQVELMVWCGYLDLLALSNSKGEVQLHRLNWHRVWSLPPPSETSLVRGLAWRPDGKILAIGYSCGRICLIDVEDKEILSINKNADWGGVTCLSWRQKTTNKKTHLAYGNANNVDTYLPPPPLPNSNYKKGDKTAGESKRAKEQTELNILLVGYENGEIHMSVFGQFSCGILDLKDVVKSGDITILDAHLSRDFTSMHVFVWNKKDDSHMLVVFNTEVLAAYCEELQAVASKHVNVMGLISYIDGSVTSIIEAWEQILLEMDSKLEKYACNVAEGGVSADFLDLLILGVPSAELELFLLQDLTAKGLKKFGTSIELSYSTIQKLVLKQLNAVCQNLSYHLIELRGLARITHRYEILGLDEEIVSEALLSSGAFFNKCLELQQVIEHSMKNYKAFFRWLFVVIVRLMDEHVPSDISKINQQDLTYIAEFLQNFDKVGVEVNPSTYEEPQNGEPREKKTGKFSLERLGQYLVDKELTIPQDDENNPWVKFLSENPCLNNNLYIIQKFKKFSLVQQQIHLKNAIQKVFNRSEKALTSHFKLFDIINCIPAVFPETKFPYGLRTAQIHDMKERSLLVAFTYPSDGEGGFQFMEILFREEKLVIRSAFFYFHASVALNDSRLDSLIGHYLKPVDVQFYSTDIISILLDRNDDEEVSAFVQFPVDLARKHAKESVSYEKGQAFNALKNTPKINACGILERGACNILEKLSANKLAVSGVRKVAVVLSKTCRKVRLFEMEADGEEEEDETLDTTQQSLSSTQQSEPSHYVSLNETGIHNFSANPIDDNPSMSESLDLDNPELV